ncbi:sulfate adenylyltransferase subunit 1 [Clostridium sp. DSM 8431]|uniref:sulfate adenylyltransferase subunit 1 n=1 Tax=Clostridium sp. DSM 8431 TaxID=1761781 RepID=UPI0008E161E0|nr:GTP-binding protein [Clostridium sp. DSM 8431]SFU71218.1 sulfate adenylyltransferase subunit 1 [Clostridium sp. DSM 8431]
MTDNNREVLNIVAVGHVDHGKSTVIGKLLYDTHSLPEGAVEKVKRIAKETGKPFEYAYLLDAFEEEQKQGITIDTTQIQFSTEKRDYVIIDAPGHKEFLKNMISGAANAEAALLIVDAKQGVQEQSRRHAYILSLLGIKKVYVIVNKMDLVDYSEEVFRKIVKEMGEFLGELNVHPLSYIPVSAFFGENILNSSEKMPWYTGHTLIESIDLVEKEKGIEDKSLRFPIQDVYKFDNRRIIAGRIESGKLKVGDKITIYPEGKETTVSSVEYWVEKDKTDEVYAGQSVGITVTDEFFNKRGEIIAFENEKPEVSNSFRANIFWMGKNDLTVGKKYKIKLTTQEVEGEIEEIVRVIDASNLDSSKANTTVALNDVAEVIIKTNEKVAFDKFSDINITGRFVLVEGYDVAGGGIITENEGLKEESLKGGFIHNGINARNDIFEEYYYESRDFSLTKEIINNNVYTIGDEVPLKGDSYDYPKDLDIIIFRDDVYVSIRNGKVTSLNELDYYEYNNVPLVNGRGFGINAETKEEVEKLLKGYEEIHDKNKEYVNDYLNQWLDIEKYRKLVFK